MGSEHSYDHDVERLKQLESIDESKLTAREKRLLQNRRSALKCKLKKQQTCGKAVKKMAEARAENHALKKEVAELTSMANEITKKLDSLNNSFKAMEAQKVLLLTQALGNSGVDASQVLSQGAQNPSFNLLLEF